MKTNKVLIYSLSIILISATWISCNKKAKQIENIENLKKLVYAGKGANFGFDQTQASMLLSAYSKFVNDFPDDTTSKTYTYEAAELAMNLGKGTDAIAHLDLYLSKYPEDKRSENALFMKGFIYSEMLHDIENARKSLESFTQKYPQSELLDDAQFMLMSLGKSDELLLKELEEKIAANADSNQVRETK
jgi:TolA-binding protein